MNAFLPIVRLSSCVLVLAGFSLLSSCKEPVEPADPQNFTIKGIEFFPTSLKITDVGMCLEIHLADDQQDITIFIRRSGFGPQTYISEDFEAADRRVMAVVRTSDGLVYRAHSGEVSIYIENTLVTGRFAFDATSGDQTLSVKNGRFPNQGISLVESPQCREFLTVGENANWTEFWYDSRGFLIARRVAAQFSQGIASSEEFYYTGSYVSHVVQTNDGIRQGIDVVYDANMRVDRLEFLTPSTKVVEFEYDDQGFLIEADGQCIAYAGGNVVQVGCSDSGPAYKYSQFDDRVNPGKLFLQALQNQPALVYYFNGENGLLLSQNNPLVREVRVAGQPSFIQETITNAQYGPDGLLAVYNVERLGNSLFAGHNYSNCFP